MSSVPDVPGMVQSVLDVVKRRALFAKQSKAMLVAKQVAHSNFVWIVALMFFAILSLTDWQILASLVLFLLITLRIQLSGEKKCVSCSWFLIISALLVVMVVTNLAIKAMAYNAILFYSVAPGLFLLWHWIIDALTHSWNRSDARTVLDVPKEEADTSMTYPLDFWVDVDLYDYRPADNGVIWKLLPKKKLEIAVLLVAIAITLLKWV